MNVIKLLLGLYQYMLIQSVTTVPHPQSVYDKKKRIRTSVKAYDIPMNVREEFKGPNFS